MRLRDPVSALETTLEEIVELLRENGEGRWHAWLSRDLALIRARDRSGIDHLLSAYGGMGSFTDLVLCPENGHRIQRSAVDATNDVLRRLSSKAWTLARDIQRTL